MHLRCPPVIHNLPRCAPMCVRPRCPIHPLPGRLGCHLGCGSHRVLCNTIGLGLGCRPAGARRPSGSRFLSGMSRVKYHFPLLVSQDNETKMPKLCVPIPAQGSSAGTGQGGWGVGGLQSSWRTDLFALAPCDSYPPPLVIATQKSLIKTVPTPTAAWTRPQMPSLKKRKLNGRKGMLCTNIPKLRALWVQVGKHSQQMCP